MTFIYSKVRMYKVCFKFMVNDRKSYGLDSLEPENSIVVCTRHETCFRINTRDQLIDRLALIITTSDHAINYKQTNTLPTFIGLFISLD